MVNRNVFFLSLASFFTDTATAMVVSVLPVYLVHHLNVGYDKLGIIVAVATFVSYLFRVLFGILSDILGKSKPFLIVGYGLSAVVKPLFAFPTSWEGIALLRALDRLGKAIRSAPRDRLLSLSAVRGQGKTFGFHKTFDVAGETLGALLALLFLTYLSKEEAYKYLFLATALPGFLALLSLIPVRDIKTTQPTGGFFSKENLKRDFYLIPPLLVLSLLSLFVWPISFFLAKSGEYNFSEGWVPILYLTANLVQVLGGYPTGKLIDILNPKWIFITTTALGWLSLILFFNGFLIFAFAFFGLHQVFFFNFFRSFIGRYATHKGTVYGVFYILYGTLSAVGATLLGHLLERFGNWVTFKFSLVGLLILTFVGFAVFGNFKAPLEGNK